MRKKIVLISIGAIVFLVAILLTYALNYREDVNIVKEGVIINLKTGTIVSKATITIVGGSSGLIERKFDGTIELLALNKELAYLNGIALVTLELNGFKDSRISALYKDSSKFRAFTSLFTDLKFTSIVIQLNDLNQISTDLFFVSELELNDAIQKSRELFKNTDFDGIY